MKKLFSFLLFVLMGIHLFSEILSVYAENTFGVSSIVLKNSKELEIIFASDLEDTPTAQREMILEEKDNFTEKYVFESLTLDGLNKNMLHLTLKDELKKDTLYKMTLLQIRDVEGKSIVNGIDSFFYFKTPSVFSTEKQELALIDENMVDSPENNEQNFSQIEESTTQTSPPETQTKVEYGLTPPSFEVTKGKNTTAENATQSGEVTNVVAAQNQTLPQTGPIGFSLIVLFSLILGTSVFYYTSKIPS